MFATDGFITTTFILGRITNIFNLKGTTRVLIKFNGRLLVLSKEYNKTKTEFIIRVRKI